MPLTQTSAFQPSAVASNTVVGKFCASSSIPALITAIMANPAGYYVNFHSTAHGGGVIRGQLTKA